MSRRLIFAFPPGGSKRLEVYSVSEWDPEHMVEEVSWTLELVCEELVCEGGTTRSTLTRRLPQDFDRLWAELSAGATALQTFFGDSPDDLQTGPVLPGEVAYLDRAQYYLDRRTP